jgi:hypothetical protein
MGRPRTAVGAPDPNRPQWVPWSLTWQDPPTGPAPTTFTTTVPAGPWCTGTVHNTAGGWATTVSHYETFGG